MLTTATFCIDAEMHRNALYAQIARMVQLWTPHASNTRRAIVSGCTIVPVMRSVIQRLARSKFDGVCNLLKFQKTYSMRPLPNIASNAVMVFMTDVATAEPLIAMDGSEIRIMLRKTQYSCLVEFILVQKIGNCCFEFFSILSYDDSALVNYEEDLLYKYADYFNLI